MEDRPRLSPVWRPYAEACMATGARLTKASLGPGRSGARLDDLARRLHSELDHAMQEAFDALPGDEPLACHSGCDHCCQTLPVAVSPVEVFALTHRLADEGMIDAALRLKIAAAGAAPAPSLASGDVPPPGSLPACPLLGEAGLCLAYRTRPLACRGCVSADESACAACDQTQPVPRSTAHQLGAAAMMKGVSDTLASLGLAGDLVDIRCALALALRDEGAEKRWLRGEDVFAPVR